MLSIFRMSLTGSMIAVLAVIALVLVTSPTNLARPTAQAQSVPAPAHIQGTVVAPDAEAEAVAAETVADDEAPSVDISNAVPISWYSDYATCVGMVGGQIAYWIITKQWWNVPPWVWPQVRAACWRFINS